MIKNGLEQSDNVIIDIRKGFATDNFIKKIVFDMLKSEIKISEVWVFENYNILRRVL